MIDETSSQWTTKETMQGIAMICAVALFLSVPTLHTKVQQMDYGKRQDAALFATKPLYNLASSTGLDEPQQQVALRADVLWDASASASKVSPRQTKEPLAPQITNEEKTAANTLTDKTIPDVMITLPPTTLPTERTVTETEPLHIWTGGDSLGQYIGARLQQNASKTQKIVVNDNYQISTGLNRPDRYDWPDYLATYFADEQPDVAILMLGGNDNKVMKANDQQLKVASEEWFKEYEQRMATIIDTAEENEVHLYWIGLPPMKDDERDAIAQNTNLFLEEQAAANHWLTYVPTISYVANDEPGFDTYITGKDGETARVRANDGVHITKNPSDHIADDLYKTITERWQTD